MKKDVKRIVTSAILSGALFSTTVAPATKVSAETWIVAGRNKKVDLELYEVLPTNEAIAWAIQTYGEAHVCTRELTKDSGRFVYAIYNGVVPDGWSPVPDQNIYGFGYLDQTTGGFAKSVYYYDYPLTQEYIDSVLKEKEEIKEEEEKEIDHFYDDSYYSSAWINNYKKRDKAYKWAYKHYKNGFAVFKREVENPYEPGTKAIIYAFSTTYEEFNNGWDYAMDAEIPSSAYIFFSSEDAKNYYYAINNRMTYKKLLKR